MFKRLFTAAVCLAGMASAATTTEHVQLALRRGEILSRATNLGGWLLSEYWMCYTSPLYKGIPPQVGITGEYGVMKYAKENGINGTAQFEEHWKTWLTEKDIADIAEAGLNTVRVSTGYWIINDEDTRDQSEITKMYPRGGLKYLDKLINDWAVKYNLAVMVSLHAHKGSQNGMDHSAPPVMGKATWSDDPSNVQSSFNYATFIANRYKDSVAFLGLSLMNEPAIPTKYETMFKYYTDAYKAIREDGNDCLISTSPWLQEQGPPTMASFMPCPDYYNVWHEFHIYYKWGFENQPLDDVFDFASKYSTTHFKPWTGNPIFLGEFSLATAMEETITEAQLSKFGEIQMKEAEKAPAGWSFWAWRHDDETKRTSGWSMRQLVKKGILTVPKTVAKRTRNPKCPSAKDRKYSNVTQVGSGSLSGSMDAANLITVKASNASNAGSGSLTGSIDPTTNLFAPEKVKAGDASNVTAPADPKKDAQTKISSAARVGVTIAAFVASSFVTMVM